MNNHEVSREGWAWEYGIEVTTPDTGTKIGWDQTQYPASRIDMEKRVDALNDVMLKAGAATVAKARLVRRKRWTRTTTWTETKEYI